MEMGRPEVWEPLIVFMGKQRCEFETETPELPRTLKILQPDVIGYSAAIHSCKVGCGSKFRY